MLNLGEIFSKLYQLRAKWYNLGLGLELSPNDLDAIQEDSRSSDKCFREMLKQWLRQNPKKNDLIKALRNPAHGDDETLANDLESWEPFSPTLDASDKSCVSQPSSSGPRSASPILIVHESSDTPVNQEISASDNVIMSSTHKELQDTEGGEQVSLKGYCAVWLIHHTMCRICK